MRTSRLAVVPFCLLHPHYSSKTGQLSKQGDGWHICGPHMQAQHSSPPHICSHCQTTASQWPCEFITGLFGTRVIFSLWSILHHRAAPRNPGGGREGGAPFHPNTLLAESEEDAKLSGCWVHRSIMAIPTQLFSSGPACKKTLGHKHTIKKKWYRHWGSKSSPNMEGIKRKNRSLHDGRHRLCIIINQVSSSPLATNPNVTPKIHLKTWRKRFVLCLKCDFSF